MTGSSARDSLLVLRTAPRRHRRLLAELLSRPLRVARGELADGLREGAALAAEHAKLAATIASMPYGLVLFDRRGGIVLQNIAAKELLKLPDLATSPEARRRIYRLLESDGTEIPYEEWPIRHRTA